MNETAAASFLDGDATGGLLRTLAELERRVQTLETRVAAMPDPRQIDERISERVKATIPSPAPAEEYGRAPTFKDISLPFPNVQTLISTARTSWTLFEMLQEVKALFWTLMDRRYHMAWITRFITITLLIMIFTSQWWLPFAGENAVSRTWEKLINLTFGLAIFLVLHFEMRRYREWLGRR